jgi:hypothetical protein
LKLENFNEKENEWHIMIKPGEKIIRSMIRTEEKSAYCYKIKTRL